MIKFVATCSLEKKNQSSFITKTFDDPYFELFLWSILCAKIHLVEFFWHKIQEPMLGAIIAGSIYSKLAAFYKNLKMSDQLSNFELLYTFKKQFEDKVNKVFIGLDGCDYRTRANKGRS